MILYINNEHCCSVEQLKGYFTENLNYDSDIYADLLDYGKNGDIAVWLREMGETELANDVESIPDDLCDSAYYAQLKVAIINREVNDFESLRPSFEKCFKFENMVFDTNEKGAKVSVNLKLLVCIKEEYTLTVCSNWGTRGKMITPNEYSEGDHVCIDFLFNKRHQKDFGNITLKVDGKEIATLNANKESTRSASSDVSSRSSSSFDFEAYRQKSEEKKIEYARQKAEERRVLDSERRAEWERQKTEEAIERFRRKHLLQF